MLKQINNYIKKNNLIPDNSRIIIALSGGPDSVFLLHYLDTIKTTHNLTVVAAHLDHEWRPDSGNDVQFCHTLCEKRGIPFVTRKISELSISGKYNGSKEDLGRQYRRHFLKNVAREYQADSIALGHHADDQQETFFIRLVRGASLTGLTSMKPHQDLFIRPLLAISKTDIVQYLQAHNIPFLQDPSNDTATFLRNRIRLNVIPALKACDSRFEKNFNHTLQRLQETEELLEQLTQDTFHTLTKTEEGKLLLSIPLFSEQHPVMQYRILTLWLCSHRQSFPVSQAFYDELMRFLREGKSPSHQLTSTLSVHRSDQWAYLQ